MKINNKNNSLLGFIGVFIALMLLFAPVSSAFASDTSSDQAQNKITEIVEKGVNLDPVDGDYVQIWIGQAFGNFIYTPWDSAFANTKPTVLAHAVGFTNVLAIILGVVIVYYVVLGGALNTANSGEVLGKQWSSIWIPIRTATGFTLIMPISTIGGGVMSFAQVFIIWVIILGSNAATVLWENTIDLILEPTTAQASYPRQGFAPAQNILSMMTCAQFELTHHNSQKDKSEIKSNERVLFYSHFKNGQQLPSFATHWSDELNSYTMRNSRLPQIIQDENVTAISFGMSGGCGMIDFGSHPTDEDDGPWKLEEYKVEAMEAATLSIKKDVANLVKALDEKVMVPLMDNDDESVSSILSDYMSKDGDGYDIFSSVLPEFYNAGKTFSTSMVNSVHTAISSNKDMKSKWSEEMKRGGWGRAGLWFYEIGSVQQLGNKVIANFELETKVPQLCNQEVDYYSFFKDTCKDSVQRLNNALAISQNLGKEATALAKKNNDVVMIAELGDTTGGCADNSCAVDSGVGSTVTTHIAQGIINTLADGNPTDDKSGLASPFQTVSSMGHFLNVTAEITWVALGIVNGGLEALSTTGNNFLVSSSGIGMGLAFAVGFGKWMLSSMAMLVTAILASGFVLAYLIPFLPVITWIMMIVGYIITVVEAVIAAPLAIILMVTPEGEGIAGTRLERAMQLLAMAILKPSLMIIGLLAAITISGTAFAIQNEFFFTAAKNDLYGNPLDIVAIIIIYTMTTLQLCKLLISIMHKLPEQILDWFSSGVGRSFGENEIGDIAGGAAGKMGEFAQGARSLGSQLGSTLKEQRKANIMKNAKGSSDENAPGGKE